MRWLSFAAALVGGLLISGSAQAIPILWTITNATFNDGTTLTGSFVYDADVGIDGTYSSISVVTMDGPIVPGGSYDDLDFLDGDPTNLRLNAPNGFFVNHPRRHLVYQRWRNTKVDRC